MTTHLPQHIGYIVDGNRRWAQARGLEAYEGHRAGREALRDVLLETLHQGVPYVSAYVFSTENWKRSPIEVKKLMDLLLEVQRDDLHIFLEENVRLRVIGVPTKLSKKLREAIAEAERRTKDLTGGQVLLCLNYGGQQEIADAAQALIDKGIRKVTPERLAQHLYAPDVPPCDLIVRTSGEQRLSNFMLWRSAYSELFFIDKPWPDMTKADVTAILEEYANRGRRFGG